MRDQPVTVDAETIFLVLEGWVCGYQIVGDGRRQINSFHVPGDIPNLSRLILPADRSQYIALNHCRLGLFPASSLREFGQKSRTISEAILAWIAQEAKIAQEWVTNLGGRKSVPRAAHLLCELSARIDAAATGHEAATYTIPLTQTDLGDALGLSTVHTNRVLQELRGLRLIEFANGHLTIPDRKRLASLAAFDPGYLYLQRPVTATA